MGYMTRQCVLEFIQSKIFGVHDIYKTLSVLKRCVPKTLAFAFGLRLRSKTRCLRQEVT